MKRITGLLVGLIIFFCIGFFLLVIIMSDNPVSDLIGEEIYLAILATLVLLFIAVTAGVAGYFVVVRQLEKMESEKDIRNQQLDS